MSAAQQETTVDKTSVEKTVPISILIGALGGQGGGVFTNWLVQAATYAGYPVQSTSIPGVAQRTGATTYFVEIFPVPTEKLNGRQPLLALFPSSGDVDVLVTFELMEAGRAVQRGFVSPDRTVVVSSSARIYAIAERSAMGNGIASNEKVAEVVQSMARIAHLFDAAALAEVQNSALNAVMLGALAGLGALPIDLTHYEQAIESGGLAVEQNLRGFRAGVALVCGEIMPPKAADLRQSVESFKATTTTTGKAFVHRIRAEYPPLLHPIVIEAALRLVDYHSPTYADLYLERLQRILNLENHSENTTSFRLTEICARQMALWMMFEDLFRVADLKTRPDRFENLRREAKARPDEPVIITEFLKPGIEEFGGMLPAFIAKPLLAWAEPRGLFDRARIGMQVRTTSITGFLQLWLLAKMRWWRPFTYRYTIEHALLERWLEQVIHWAIVDYDLACELAECAGLVKGYGETRRRGIGNLTRILDDGLIPLLKQYKNGEMTTDAASLVKRMREAALADEAGTRLEKVITEINDPSSL